MSKCLVLLIVLGLAGCSSAPLMSSGLSAEPASAGPVADYVEQPVVTRRPAVRRVAVERVRHPPVAQATAGEEPADRAARALDADVQRLERAARAATSSICRGC